MASDKISLTAEVVAEALGEVLKERDRVPPRTQIARVAGPTSGVTHDFAVNLAITMRYIAVRAELLSQQLSYYGEAARDAIAALEETDRISAEAADNLEGLLGSPLVNPPMASPSPSPTGVDTTTDKTSWS